MNAGVRWLTAFLDTTDERSDASEEFWAGVTGYRVSERRGRDQEFATLLPETGDAHLALQQVRQSTPGGLHLDLHADDVRELAAHAEQLGASASYQDAGYVVCGSPGGMTFCLVDHPAARRTAPTPWSGGASLVDQVCLDISPSVWESECRFWSELTGWALDDRDPTDEFVRLRRDEQMTLQVLLQRLDDEASVVVGHLDVACDDLETEVRRHEALGAAVVGRYEWWVTMRDPSGRAYCITARPPS